MQGWGMAGTGLRAPVGTAGSRPASHTLVLSCDLGACPRGPVAPSLATLPAAGPAPAPAPAPSGAGAEGGCVPLQLLLWLLSGSFPFTQRMFQYICVFRSSDPYWGPGGQGKKEMVNPASAGAVQHPTLWAPRGLRPPAAR